MILGLECSVQLLIVLSNIAFGNVNSAYIWMGDTFFINLTNNIIINGTVTNVGLGAFAFAALSEGTIGVLPSPPATMAITISIPITVNAFILCTGISVFQVTYNSLTGGANVTGSRFTVQFNSFINTNGGGLNYFPGTTPGTVTTGSQYF